MPKNLVIVESPKKAKVIKKYLGPDYSVVASMGHVIDLPPKGLNVNIKKDFLPTYDVIEGKEAVVKDIVSQAKKVDTVYLMSDPDREGEAIAWHIKNELPDSTVCKRATTTSITKSAVKAALDNATDIDYDMVDSYETRRIVDRLVGYKCSYLTKQATGGKSVGRTQSAALRILAEREKEIQNFVPQEYWVIEADLITPRSDIIHAHLSKPDKMKIDSEEKAKKITDYLEGKEAECSKYEEKEQKQNPYPPFKTSTLQTTASSLFKWNSKKTMQVAQSLYEQGHITYMRTDALIIEPDTLSNLRDYIDNKYGKKYLPSKTKYYSNKKGALAQGAHEAIRPTEISMESAGTTADEKKLYQLIWRRTVACQMNPANYKKISAVFTCGQYELSANGSQMLFDGFRKVWTYGGSEDKDIAEIHQGEKCPVKNIESEQKFTQPPPRYSEGSIVKKLEETGIGRPSTYASLIETLKARDYVKLTKGKSFEVTDLGMKVNDFLVSVDFCFVDVNFTKDMESLLDDIGEKKTAKIDVLTDFWKRLKGDIDNAKVKKNDLAKTDYKCAKCGAFLLQKHSQYGPFYACENKECKTIFNIADDGSPVEKKKAEFSDFDCQLCGAKMVKRKSAYGEFLGCSKYPSCKGMRTADGEVIEKKKKKGSKKWPKKKKSK